MALERTYGLPRGMLVSRAPDADTIIDRVLTASHLDCDVLRRLTRILTATVRDWAARRHA